MTKFHGVFLFDIAEDPIGDWENDVKTRGMFERWYIEDSGQAIIIEPYYDEDNQEPEYEGEWHVMRENENTGFWDTIGFYSTFEQADEEAKKYMRKHPNGWKE